MRISVTDTRPEKGRWVQGFTLLELMVVLAIAALIASITLPNLKLPGFASNAATAARQIASGLAKARQAAIFSNRESRFILNMENKTFSIDGGPPIELSGIQKVSLLTADRDVLSETEGAIRFYPDGSAGGGEITVLDGTGTTASLKINWLTGRIILDG